MSSFSISEYLIHHRDLATAFKEVLLIDTDRVDPHNFLSPVAAGAQEMYKALTDLYFDFIDGYRGDWLRWTPDI